MLPRIVLTITASILTTTGITIAVTSGVSLGTNFIDKFVYIGIAVSASLITQFLPARKGGVKKWLIFSIAAFVTMLVTHVIPCHIDKIDRRSKGSQF